MVIVMIIGLLVMIVDFKNSYYFKGVFFVRKYSLSTDVLWGDILHLLRWRLRILNKEGLLHISCYNESIKHNYQNYVAYNRAAACQSAEKVLHLFSVLNGLRKFLRYKVYTFSDLELDELVAFYEAEKDNVKSDDIVIPDTSDHLSVI